MRTNHCPNYLASYRDLHAGDPHAANLKWFADANYGLFLHYGLYSQLERHEWVMYKECIPVAEYEKLAESFDPSGFDADFITDLACEAGMKYVNLTTCHHEGFCLWDSKVELFNAMTFARVEGQNVFSARRGAVYLAYRDLHRGVRTRQHKLIEYVVNGQHTMTQVFDVLADPLETRNLADDAALVETLRRQLFRLRDEWDDRASPWGQTFWTAFPEENTR